MTSGVRSALNADAPGHRTARSLGANETRKALKSYDWPDEDYIVGSGRWKVYTHPALDYLAVWVDTEVNKIAISEDTWATLAHEETAIGQFFRDMTGGASGMKFIVADVGPYALAVRRQITAEDKPLTETDSISRIEQAANNLIHQVASMNRRPTQGQQQVFAEKYAAIRSELAAAEQRLALARSSLDLASTALVDSTS